MGRMLILLFGVAAYAVFLPTFLYLVAFTGNLQTTALADSIPALAWLVPHSISAGRETGSAGLAIIVNLGLLTLFGLQHSAMARMGFKSWLKRLLPGPAERSVYVLITSLVLIVLFWQWRPLPQEVWSVDSTTGQALVWTVFAAGFTLVFVATFLIDHFELFGLKQAWAQFRRQPVTPPRFVTPAFYRIVRHPLYLGFLIAFWATPQMTMGHLLFAAGMTVYILIGARLEERDLETWLGDDYRRYRQQVPQLFPVPGRYYRGPDGG